MSCLQVHQVDTGHLQERRSQSRAPSSARTLHQRAPGGRPLQEGHPLLEGLDPVCKCHLLARRILPSALQPGQCVTLLILLQADLLPEPRDVFTFLKVCHSSLSCRKTTYVRWPPSACMHDGNASQWWGGVQEHDIGQEFAMYYIAYAAFSELRGNFTKAESIYQHGLQR